MSYSEFFRESDIVHEAWYVKLWGTHSFEKSEYDMFKDLMFDEYVEALIDYGRRK